MASAPDNLAKKWLPRTLADHYTLVEAQPYQPNDGVRVQPRTWSAQGYRDVVRIAEGFSLLVADIRHSQDMKLAVDCQEDVVKFHYRLSGAGFVGLRGRELDDIARQSATVLLHRKGTVKEERFIAGEHEQSVTLLCARSYMNGRMPEASDLVPSELASYLKGAGAEYFRLAFPLRADISLAVTALLQSELTGSLRHLQAEAKALELLTLSIGALIEVEADRARPERRLSKRDVDNIHRAREILDARFLNPPTIELLAREVGVNEAKLLYAFKQLYSQTIFDYTQRLRMEKAKALLETTDRSVTEIAFDVGYEYSSNFTSAFKRHFGVTPRAVRTYAKT